MCTDLSVEDDGVPWGGALWNIQVQRAYLKGAYGMEVVHHGEEERHDLGAELHAERVGQAVHAELRLLPLPPVAPSAAVLSSLHTLAAPCGTPASPSVTAASATPAVGGTCVRERVKVL